MRLPRVRITLRRMMVLVGVAAFMMATGGGCGPDTEPKVECLLSCIKPTRPIGPVVLSQRGADGGKPRKAKVHRQASRMNWWAFFDPFHECVLDKDIY